LELGQRVRIEDGALSGVEGVLTSFRGTRRIVVSISLLRRSVALEIDRCAVSAVQPKHSGAQPSRVIVPSFEPVVA
jgi:transcription antitermination factor NusG